VFFAEESILRSK